MVNEEGREIPRETARRALQAAAVEAYGRAGAYVTRSTVMQRAKVASFEEFLAIAQHLDRRGWIDEADADYSIFVLTREGIDEATD